MIRVLVAKVGAHGPHNVLGAVAFRLVGDVADNLRNHLVQIVVMQPRVILHLVVVAIEPAVGRGSGKR